MVITMRKFVLRNLRFVMLLVFTFIDVLIAWVGWHKVTTISCQAALARNAGKKWGCVLCTMLDDVDPNHCDDALKKPIGGLK
jgi:hypothetical protein